MRASRTRTRPGGLRIGLVVCTVVVLTAACGSIDVVTGDAGGSGGAPGGGSGGMHAGGSGGSAGAHGSGGAQGSGGTIGGGTGGNRGSGGSMVGGSGGMIGGGIGGTQGSGGMTGGGIGGGSGSDAGAGGAGGSGPSCASLQKAFTIALANAKSCVVGATGYCGVTTPDKLECGCPTHVNDTKNIDPIRTQWAQSGCASMVCPGVVCIAYKGATCAVPSGATAAVCTDSLTLPTP